MILSDNTIEELCTGKEPHLIAPYNGARLQPASYDLSLGEVLDYPIGVRKLLEPGEFIIASTKETVHIPSNLVGRMEGKSSLARQGLIVHTAGFVDPGFCGQLTLEITNLSKEIRPLDPGMLIAQIAFTLLDRPSNRPYGTEGLGSHYQYQKGPTASHA